MTATTAHADILATKDPSARLGARRRHDSDLGSARSPTSPTSATASPRSPWEHFDVDRVGSTLGAEITGVDLTTDLDDAVIDEIAGPSLDYKVIFFRDQPLTSSSTWPSPRRFGELEIHPFIPVQHGHPRAGALREDRRGRRLREPLAPRRHLARRRPSMGAVLHAIEIPPVGGDTLFSDMYAAYEGLSDEHQGAHRRPHRPPRLPAGLRRRRARRAQGRDRASSTRWSSTRSCSPTTSPASKLLYVNRVFTDAHRRARPRRERRAALGAVPPGRDRRVPGALPLAAPLDRVLGQPGRAALRLERLLARAPGRWSGPASSAAAPA